MRLYSLHSRVKEEADDGVIESLMMSPTEATLSCDTNEEDDPLDTSAAGAGGYPKSTSLSIEEVSNLSDNCDDPSDNCDYACSNTHLPQEHPAADCEEPNEGCDYTLAEPSGEKVQKTHAAYRSFLCEIPDGASHSHAGETPSACEICDLTSAFSADSKRFKMTLTGEKQVADVLWGCAVCNFRSANRWNLENHVITHSEETPFSCTLCGYYFATACALESHLRGHHYDVISEQAASLQNSPVEDRKNLSGNRDYTSRNSHHPQNHPGTDHDEPRDYNLAETSDVKLHLKTDTEPFMSGIHDSKSTHASSAKCLGRTNAKNYQYKCGFCSYVSPIVRNVKVHQKVHTREKLFSCALCFLRTSNRWNLENHVKKHLRKTRFSCEVCKYYFASAYILENHLRSHQWDDDDDEQERVLSNPSVNDESNSSDNRDCASSKSRHPQMHPGEGCDYNLVEASEENISLKTDAINMPFMHENIVSSTHASSAAGDMSVMHENIVSTHASSTKVLRTDAGYACDIHEYTAAYPSALKTPSLHTGEKPFACDVCDYTCAGLSRLKRHQVIHTGKKPFCCAVCSHRCNNKWNLKQHEKTHLRKTHFFCKVCRYYVASGSTLQDHLKSHYPDADQDNTIPPSKSVGETSNSSDIRDYASPGANCEEPHGGGDYTLAETSDVKVFLKTDDGLGPFIHKIRDNAIRASPANTHAEERQLTMEVSDYTFDHAYALKSQLVSSTEETPPARDACFFIPPNDSGLKSPDYAGERNYPCQPCDYTFADARASESHGESHAEEKTCCTQQSCECTSSHTSVTKSHKRSLVVKKPFTCELCDYTSNTAYKLERHKKRMKHDIVNVSDKFAEKRRLIYSGYKY